MRAANSNENVILSNWKGKDRLDLTLPQMSGPLPGPEVLHSLRTYQTDFIENPDKAPKWLILHLDGKKDCGSGTSYLAKCSAEQNYEALRYYAENSYDMISDNLGGQGGNVITIAVVKEKANALSFAIALSCDYLIASERAEFSLRCKDTKLPAAIGSREVLERKIGRSVAREILQSREVFSAEGLKDLGLVTHLSGIASIEKIIESLTACDKKHASIVTMRRLMGRSCPIFCEDMENDLDEWLDAAMSAGLSVKEQAGHTRSIRQII